MITKLLGGSLAAMGALALFLYISLLGEQRHSAKLETRLVEAEAKLGEVMAANDHLAREGDRRKAEVERARSIGDEGIKAARSEAEMLRNLPANNCPTPREILEAYQ